MRSLIAAAMLTLGISSASADQLDPTVQQLLDPTVHGLYLMCKGQDTSDNLMCIAYVAGVGDLLRAQHGKGEKYDLRKPNLWRREAGVCEVD